MVVGNLVEEYEEILVLGFCLYYGGWIKRKGLNPGGQEAIVIPQMIGDGTVLVAVRMRHI